MTRRQVCWLSVVLVFLAALPAILHAQSYDGIARARARSMFDQVTEAVRKTYYDQTFHGMDIEAHFKRASEKLDRATSMNQALAVIAQALMDLNDSHTYFTPPSRTVSVDYGWRDRMIGDQCYVVAVRPGSDADAKGVKPGDRILSIQGFRPTRSELWKVHYFYHLLNPMTGIRLTVLPPGGQQPRELEIESKITQRKRALDATDLQTVIDLLNQYENELVEHRFQKKGNVAIWQMPAFDLSPEEIDDVMNGKVKGASTLVLDLRGNPGGDILTLERLVSHFFDREVRIADVKSRKKMEPVVAKKRGGKPFEGKVVVLVDSDSGSCAELFARVMQIEKRGTVIGDRSSGGVMQAEYFDGRSGSQSEIFFGAYISDADLIMGDGKSLEKAGVTPDEMLLPTPEDLRSGRDPVLARAAALAGEPLDPAVAGRLFPIKWKK